MPPDVRCKKIYLRKVKYIHTVLKPETGLQFDHRQAEVTLKGH